MNTSETMRHIATSTAKCLDEAYGQILKARQYVEDLEALVGRVAAMEQAATTVHRRGRATPRSAITKSAVIIMEDRAEAGDPAAREVMALCEEAGLTLSTSWTPGSVRCVTLLERMQATDPELLGRTLKVVAGAWKGDPDTTRGEVLEGVARFLLDLDPVYDSRLIQALETVTPTELNRAAMGPNKRRAISEFVADVYTRQ
jgi:hypothetical protein